MPEARRVPRLTVLPVWLLLRMAWTRCDLLRRVLHVAIAERPVLAPVIHQVDPDVLFADAGLRVNFVGNAPVELLLDVGRAAADPGHLDDDEVRRVLDTKIALLRIDDLVGAVASHDLELVVDRYIRNFDHRTVDGLADDSNALGGRVLVEVDSDEWHRILLSV